MSSLKVIPLRTPDARWRVLPVYEDARVWVLDKPAGLAPVPLAAEPEIPSLTGLLHEAIRRQVAWSREAGREFLKPVNRVATEGSGLMVFAKSTQAAKELGDWFGANRFVREYEVLVQGLPDPPEGEIDEALQQVPRNPGRYRIAPKSRSGRQAITQYRVLEAFRNHAFVVCRLATDRPDQIPVHFRHRGFPVAGALDYGGKPVFLSGFKRRYHLPKGKVEKPLLARTGLHLARLEIPDEEGGRRWVGSSLPQDMKVTLEYLRRFSRPAGRPGQMEGESSSSSSSS